MDNWLKKITFGCAAVALLQGCSLFDSEEDTVVMAELPVITQSYEPQQQWQTSVGDGVEHYYSQLRPAFIDSSVYVADREGIVKALDINTGQQLWQIDLSEHEANVLKRGARISGAISASYDAIYLGTENAQLFAIDAETGEVRWVANTGGEVIAKPLLEGGKVIVHNSRGDLYAFQEYNGEKLWQLTLDQPALTLRSSSEPIEAGGAVLYGRADGKFAAVFTENGMPIWERRVAVPKGATELDRIVDVDAKPLVVGTTAYVIAYNGELLAIDLQSGETLWKRSYSAYNSMDISGFTLYLTDDKGHIYAVDRRNGAQIWSNTQLEYRNLTAPLVAGEYILVGDAEGYLHWLDSDGRFVAQQELDSDGLYTVPVLYQDKVIVQTRSGKVIALSKP
ncbi:outer membrane protein assembly factor BamB [Motilimonas sp. 1_MG-2023]|uniref:outer membrane protein assembly factor BamB n=1 Tax=Motilimonas sp. 1_MG-2023 TaxID=3062672 RepID=UPI0026E1DAE9|nr:outer membrane protein assembly factor BamB [Motilimonas sp. 1_MG-2023]MDO6527997.1 outer membrane protein assembly factor BamB [Motilimonas sp. 1_MG-2023]